MELINATLSNLAWLKYLTVPLLGILVIWYTSRARTVFALMERVWRVVAGKAEIENAHLKKLCRESIELEKFRFVYGINIKTHRDLDKFMRWYESINIDMPSIQRAARWVEPSSHDIIRMPSTFYRAFVPTAFILISLIMAAAMSLTSSRYALFSGNQSGAWFTTDGHRISNLLGTKIIDLNSCEAGVTDITNSFAITSNEVSELCNKRGDELSKMVGGDLYAQRIFLTVIVFFSGIFTIWIGWLGRSFTAAIDLRRRLNLPLRSAPKIPDNSAPNQGDRDQQNDPPGKSGLAP